VKATIEIIVKKKSTSAEECADDLKKKSITYSAVLRMMGQSGGILLEEDQVSRVSHSFS